VRTATTDDNGFLREEELPVPSRCTLSFGYPPPPNELPADPPDRPFQIEMFLDYADEDDEDHDEGARRRLHNLGYPGQDLKADVAAFQEDFGLAKADWFHQPTWDELRRVHDDL